MLDLIKKTKLTGIGLVKHNRQEIEILASALQEKGELSETEAAELLRIHQKLNTFLKSTA